MRIANPQRWDVTPVEAEALQRRLRGEVVTDDDAYTVVGQGRTLFSSQCCT